MNVVIIGVGLIGASIGAALVAAGVDVHLEDRMSSHALVAASLGAGSLEPADPDDVDLVIVATPPNAIVSVVFDALRRFPQAAIIDVGSVKGVILERLAGQACDLRRYVGSHPMAGSEHSGPLTANKDLFEGRTWVIAPGPDAEPWAIERVSRLAELCRANVVTMPGAEHDRAVARVSHVPQIMSSLTAGHLTEAPADHLRLAGQGVRDVTRIAGSDPGLWRQIIGGNVDAIRAELIDIRDDLNDLLAVLSSPAKVEDFLKRGREGVKALPGKHGRRRGDWTTMVVQIPDAPGALAELFAVIGQAGVNIEDLTIEHDAARNVGFLSIQVAADAVSALREQVAAHQWRLADTIGPVDELVIAIDGPSGAGKSSTSRRVAERLGLGYLDTGAMYRAVTAVALADGVADDDVAGLIDVARSLDLEMGTDPTSPTVRARGSDLTARVREPEISQHVSAAAQIPEVRQVLTDQMREIVEHHQRRIVLEGRDATTVIWPQAQVRVLLVADATVRVARREAELAGAIDRDAVTDQVIRRDRDDSKVSEFMRASDGVVTIDSTDLGLDEVVDVVCRLAGEPR